MEDIDKSLPVVGPKQPSRAVSFRHISIGENSYITKVTCNDISFLCNMSIIPYFLC